jgi:hypothetical protein
MLRAWPIRIRRVVMLVVMVLGAVGSAPAQEAEDAGPFREPGIEFKAKSSAKPYIDWLFGALLIAGSAFLLFKNPHRSHMD